VRQAPRGTALWWPILLLGLSIAILIGSAAAGGPLELANPDRTSVSEVRAAFEALPDDALVLMAMDADLGTYPEILPAVRAAMDDLIGRGASLGFVSVSVEGRAIAVAELARLRDGGTEEDALLDLGFISGVEAGLVLLVGDALPSGATGVMADTVTERGGGLAAFDMIVLVGGTDVGPRTWVEQVGPRLPELPMMAVAPTFAEPELAPYLRTGQLVALLATVRDDAAFVESVAGEDDESSSLTTELPTAAAMLLGMLVALAVLLRALVGALPRLRQPAPRRAVEDDDA
jgi:hypothetical protein